MKFNKKKFRLNISKNINKFLPPRKKNIKKCLYFIGILIFIYVYIAGDYGVYQLIIKKSEEKRLKEDIEYLKVEQKILKKEKELINKGDLNEIEKIARRKYGLAKPGEKVYHIVIKGEE
ncbi:MAG: septum formation initiator family protein [Candidatus Helarchaeota archaeon]|nr:septum formation initiator family protein [Candidatus Helarchaeota archaeon]